MALGHVRAQPTQGAELREVRALPAHKLVVLGRGVGAGHLSRHRRRDPPEAGDDASPGSRVLRPRCPPGRKQVGRSRGWVREPIQGGSQGTASIRTRLRDKAAPIRTSSRRRLDGMRSVGSEPGCVSQPGRVKLDAEVRDPEIGPDLGIRGPSDIFRRDSDLPPNGPEGGIESSLDGPQRAGGGVHPHGGTIQGTRPDARPRDLQLGANGKVVVAEEPMGEGSSDPKGFPSPVSKLPSGALAWESGAEAAKMLV